MGLTIGKLADSAGVGVETVRYYERRGLIDQPARRSGGYRQYSEATISRLTFIRRAQELGFTLKEIAELIALDEEAAAECSDVRELAIAKVAAVQKKVDDLLRMRAALEGVIARCENSACTPVRDCPVMECLRD
jgi:MerR family transcriptional regulator, copper efflux regulator